MRYRSEIFDLYDGLFKEAHASLNKEGGLIRTIGRGFRTLGRGLSGAAERELAVERAAHNTTRGHAVEQASRHEQAIGDAAHQQGLREFDVAALHGIADKERKLRLVGEERVRQLGADPNAWQKAEQAATDAQAATAQAQQRTQQMKNLAIGTGVAGVAAAPIAYGMAQSNAEDKRKRTRNIAFGAGAAAGLAAPQVIRGLGSLARGAGQTGLFPEVEGFQGVDPSTYLGNTGGGY